MFRKRIKKEFPPGTFIPTPARVVAIIQLCLAFSLLLWQASQPFMGDLFHIRSQMLVHHDVMGINKRDDATQEDKDRLARNAERFANLPKNLKKNITEKYVSLQRQLDDSFKQKMERLLHIFVYEVSLYELAWIFFSIIISVMLLKRVDGARHAAWLLPALALLFLLDSQKQGTHRAQNPENQLFPSEQTIVESYLKEPLRGDILTQRELLLRGWNIYLIQKWAHEKPSEDPNIFKTQTETGEFAFNVMRLEKSQLAFPASHPSLFLMSLYVVWNGFFAWFINKHLKKEKVLFSSNSSYTI